MKLHVNLLSDDERRSASPIRIKTLAPLAGTVTAGLIVLWIVMTVLSISHRRSQLRSDKWKWSRMEADYIAAVQTRSDLHQIEGRLAELSAYQRMRVEWHDVLRKLGGHTPTNIQLTELRVSQSIITDAKTPSRAYTLRLQGRTSGPAAEPTVRAFLTDLGSHPDFTNLIASATVPAGAFRGDTSAGATEEDRVFEINCVGRPRKIE